MAQIDDFVSTYGPLATDVGQATGLDPSVVMGIMGHETGLGQHVSGNNMFGISPGGSVAGYPDVPSAAQDFVRLMKTPRYASAISQSDPASQAQALTAAGYGPAQDLPEAVAKGNARGSGYANAILAQAQAVKAAGFGAPSTDDLMGMIAPPKAAPGAGTVQPVESGPSADDILQMVAPTKTGTTPATTAPAKPAQPANSPSDDISINSQVGGVDNPPVDITSIPGKMLNAQPVQNIIQAAKQGYNETPNLLNPGPQSYLDNLPYPVIGTLVHGGNALLGGMGGAFKGAQQTVAELGNMVPANAGGKLGNDLAGMMESAPIDAAIIHGGAAPPNPLAMSPADARIASVADRARAQAATPLTDAEVAPIGSVNPVNANPLSANVAPGPSTDVATQNPLAAGAPASVGAAGTPTALSGMTPKEIQDARSTAEVQRLITPNSGPHTEQVPGVFPSAATIEQDANLAREEKMSEAAMPQQWQDASAANNAARQRYFQDMVGSPTVTGAAEANAQADYLAGIKQSFDPANRKPVAPADVEGVHQMMTDDVLNHPQNIDNPVLQKYIAPLVDKLVDKDGNAAILDPQRLYGIRQEIGRLQGKAAAAEDPNLTHIVGELQTFKDALDPVIESGAPGFQNTIDNYSAAQRPIEVQKALQTYETGSQNSNGIYDSQNRMTYNGVHNMMRDVVTDRASADPNSPFKSLSDEDMDKLWNLHDSLQAVATAKEKARARGSDTAQNLLDFAKGYAGEAAAHVAAGMVAPGLGNIAVRMGTDAITKRYQANKLAKRTGELINPLSNPLYPGNIGNPTP